jgi:hypothetical protein
VRALRGDGEIHGAEVFEAPREARAAGKLFQIRMQEGIYSGKDPCAPVCFRHVANLYQQIQTENSTRGGEFKNDREKVALIVLGWDRDCPHWHEYFPGLSPTQTVGEVRLAAFEREARGWHEAREADRREWELRREADNAAIEQRQRKHDRRLVILGLVLGILCATRDSLGPAAVAALWHWAFGDLPG